MSPFSRETTALSFEQRHLFDTLVSQFSNTSLYLETLAVLVFAVLLGWVLAYHPSTRRKSTTRAGLEQPKTMVLYALVGALVGHLVRLNEMMALVVFGIGGLLRFRTDVGEAKDTGRVILAALVGICAGLQTFMIAVFATVFGWVLIWYLERQIVGSVQILGVQTPHMAEASAAYRDLLAKANCEVVGEERNAKKERIDIIFTAPRHVDRQALALATESVPESARGVPAWEFS